QPPVYKTGALPVELRQPRAHARPHAVRDGAGGRVTSERGVERASAGPTGAGRGLLGPSRARTKKKGHPTLHSPLTVRSRGEGGVGVDENGGLVALGTGTVKHNSYRAPVRMP